MAVAGVVLCAPGTALAQPAPKLPNFGQMASEGAQKTRIQVTADGENRIEDGIAYAEKNVELIYGETTLYCDKLTFDTKNGWAEAAGSVRIYTDDGTVWAGDRMRYNMKTKGVDGDNIRFVALPVVGSVEKIRTLGSGDALKYQADNSLFSTENVQQPGFRVTPRVLSYEPGEHRYVMQDAVVSAGSVPLLWVPSLVYDPGGADIAVQFVPGYTSEWGAFLLMGYGFELSKNVHMKTHVDLRSARGVAGGVDFRWIYGRRKGQYSKEGEYGQGEADLYYAHDDDPFRSGDEENKTGDYGRYRFRLKQRAYLTEGKDIYANVSVNKMSDKRFERDFFEHEFREERIPDNFVELVKYDPNYTVTLLARQQLNDFFETVEREPEISLDIKRQPLDPGGWLEYNGQTSVTQFDRKFSNEDADMPQDFNALRMDTYHQLTVPGQLFGWLNLAPRAGMRLTYYSDSWGEDDDYYLPAESYGMSRAYGLMYGSDDEVSDRYGRDRKDFDTVRVSGADGGDGVLRAVFNLGLEGSFKLSRTWDVQRPNWGIDGIRHVIEPFLNFSYIPDPNISADRIMQFDGRLPSTRLVPLDFPQYNSIDSLDNQLIARTGFRQKWQTHRNGRNWDIFEWATYIDFDLEGHIYNDHLTSNLYNEMTFRPVDWVKLQLFGATDLYGDGFHEYNARMTWQVARPLELRMNVRHISGHEFFEDSTKLSLGWLWRLSEDWSVGTRHIFEGKDSVLELQEYSLYRDLTSWRMAATTQLRDNGGTKDEVLFYLTFTLKAWPEADVPVGYRSGSTNPLTLGD